MARKAEQGALQYAASVTEVNPPRIGGAGFISGVFNDFLANPRLPFNRLTPIGRWLGYFWDSKVAPLALNFADGTNTLDSRITFSRSSNATVTDSNGNIVYAPHNLVTFSEQFDNAAWIKLGTATVTTNSSLAPNGTNTADTLNLPASSDRINPAAVTITGGLSYVFSVWLAGSGTVNLTLATSGGTYTVSTQQITLTSTLTRYSVTINTLANNTGLFCVIGRYDGFVGTGTATSCNVWGAQLNVGSLQPYYPTTVKNLLGFSEAFENAAWTKSNSFIQTNLLTFSEQFDNTAWTKTNATITANAIIAPSLSLTGDKLVENTATDVHRTERSTTIVASTSYTFSFYAKASERTVVYTRNDSTGANANAAFNLANGTVQYQGAGQTASIQSVGDGWYRCSVTATSGAAVTSANFRISLSNTAVSSDSAITYTGDGTSGIYIWGAQLVQGASAGDYVQTTSTALPVMYQAPNGTMTADKLVETTANNFHQMLSGTIAVISGTIYTFSIYAKKSERRYLTFNASSAFFGTQDFCIYDLEDGVITQQGTSGTASITPIGNGWFRCSRTLTASSSGNSVAVWGISDSSTGGRAPSYTGDGTSGIYIWGAQLSDSASLDPYVNNPVAAPSSTAFYGPRFDYDPVTRQPRGLLIEEARTNLLLQSEAFDNASWIKIGGSITANSIVSPDGTQDADTFVETASGTGQSSISQSISYTNAVIYTASIYVKKGTESFCQLIFGAAAFGANAFANFNVNSGQLGTVGSSATATITNVGNDWYRCTMTATATATASANFQVNIIESASDTRAPNITYNSGTIFYWGAQVEAGAFPTSYIPTTTATVTRAADVAVIQGTNFSSWYKYDEGTLFGEINDAAITVSGVARRIANINNGTENNRLTVSWAGATAVAAAFVTDGGVAQANFTSPSGAYPFPTKVALAYRVNDFQAAVNGSVFATDTSGTLPTVDRMTIGDVVTGANGTQNINGHIRRINYYSRRLDNSQLQAITQ